MSMVSDERVQELLLTEELYEGLKTSFDTIADQLCDRETKIRKLAEILREFELWGSFYAMHTLNPSVGPMFKKLEPTYWKAKELLKELGEHVDPVSKSDVLPKITVHDLLHRIDQLERAISVIMKQESFEDAKRVWRDLYPSMICSVGKDVDPADTRS